MSYIVWCSVCNMQPACKGYWVGPARIMPFPGDSSAVWRRCLKAGLRAARDVLCPISEHSVSSAQATHVHTARFLRNLRGSDAVSVTTLRLLRWQQIEPL